MGASDPSTEALANAQAVVKGVPCTTLGQQQEIAACALALAARLSQAEEALRRLRVLVDEQAEDEGLWAVYPVGEQPIMEAFLQQELRRLHAAVESETTAFAASSAGETGE